MIDQSKQFTAVGNQVPKFVIDCESIWEFLKTHSRIDFLMGFICVHWHNCDEALLTICMLILPEERYIFAFWIISQHFDFNLF